MSLSLLVLYCYSIISTGLDGNEVQSHLHVLAQAILKTRVVCHMPKTLNDVFPHLLRIHSFSTLSIMIMITRL